MIKNGKMIFGLIAILLVISSCIFSQEEITNKTKKIFDDQVSKIDSNLVKKIDQKVNDLDSLINKTTAKSIRDQIDHKIKDADTLINGIKKSVDIKLPLIE